MSEVQLCFHKCQKDKVIIAVSFELIKPTSWEKKITCIVEVCLFHYLLLLDYTYKWTRKIDITLPKLQPVGWFDNTNN